MQAVESRFDLAIADYAALYDFSISRPEDFWRLMWDFGGVRGTMGRARRRRSGSDARRALLPRRHAELRREPARRTAATASPCIFKGEGPADPHDDLRRALRRSRRVCVGASRPRASSRAIASRDTSRTCPKRSSRRSGRRRWAPCGPRARRISARRACSIGSGRSSRRFSSPPTATRTPASSTTARRGSPRSCVRCRRCGGRCSFRTSAAAAAPTIRDVVGWDEFVSSAPSDDATLRAAAVQPSALHPLFVRHDRRSEVHRPRRRRHAHPAPEGAPAPLRHRRRRPRLLLHDLRLDDVELARLGARVGRDAGPLRRLAVPSGRQHAVRSGRRDGHDALRDVGEVHRRRRQGGPGADRVASAGSRAHHHVDRIAPGTGELRLRLRAESSTTSTSPPSPEARTSSASLPAATRTAPCGAGRFRRGRSA